MTKSSLDYAELAGLYHALASIKADTECEKEKIVKEWMQKRIELLKQK